MSRWTLQRSIIATDAHTAEGRTSDPGAGSLRFPGISRPIVVNESRSGDGLGVGSPFPVPKPEPFPSPHRSRPAEGESRK